MSSFLRNKIKRSEKVDKQTFMIRNEKNLQEKFIITCNNKGDMKMVGESSQFSRK